MSDIGRFTAGCREPAQVEGKKQQKDYAGSYLRNPFQDGHGPDPGFLNHAAPPPGRLHAGQKSEDHGEKMGGA